MRRIKKLIKATRAHAAERAFEKAEKKHRQKYKRKKKQRTVWKVIFAPFRVLKKQFTILIEPLIKIKSLFVRKLKKTGIFTEETKDKVLLEIKNTYTFLTRDRWYVQGPIAALSITSFIPGFLPYKLLEGLTFLHSIIIGWRFITKGIGEYISAFLFIPPIPSYLINLVLFFLSIGMPAIKLPLTNYRRCIRYNWYSGRALSILWLVTIAVLWNGIMLTARVEGLVIFDGVQLSLFAIFSLITIVSLARGSPKTLSRAMSIMSGVLTIEVLFWLNTPGVIEIITIFSDFIISQDS